MPPAHDSCEPNAPRARCEARTVGADSVRSISGERRRGRFLTCALRALLAGENREVVSSEQVRILVHSRPDASQRDARRSCRPGHTSNTYHARRHQQSQGVGRREDAGALREDEGARRQNRAPRRSVQSRPRGPLAHPPPRAAAYPPPNPEGTPEMRLLVVLQPPEELPAPPPPAGTYNLVQIIATRCS